MEMQREQLFRFFFLGVLIFLLYQVLRVLSPFYTGILGAVVVSLIFYPIHGWSVRLIGEKRPNLATAFSTFLVIVLIIIPFIFFTWLLLNELTNLYPVVKKVGMALKEWRQGGSSTVVPWLETLEEKIANFFGVGPVNLQDMMMESVRYIVTSSMELLKKLPKNALAFIINISIMILTLFFILRDGKDFFKRIKELIPMEIRYKDEIESQIYLTLTAVIRGVFVVAVTQGLISGIGFTIVGSSSAVTLGFATVIAALIPFVGAAAIWIPVVIYYFAQGVLWKWLFLLLWGLLVVSLVDNLIRPYLIGNRAKLPILFLFFGLLGGVKVYGPLGLFLGPLVVALMIAFINIYREEYRS